MVYSEVVNLAGSSQPDVIVRLITIRLPWVVQWQVYTLSVDIYRPPFSTAFHYPGEVVPSLPLEPTNIMPIHHVSCLPRVMVKSKEQAIAFSRNTELNSTLYLHEKHLGVPSHLVVLAWFAAHRSHAILIRAGGAG